MKKLFISFAIISTIIVNGAYANISGDQKNDTKKSNRIKKTAGKTFKSSLVTLGTSVFKGNAAYKVIENKIGKQVLFMPEEQRQDELIECYGNAFIMTINTAYDNHLPLMLTPDAVWLLISQGVSTHINLNYDSLKDKIFKADKPDEISKRNDNLEHTAHAWIDLIDQISDETKLYTNSDFYSFFVPNFSTTSAINTTVYQITMLESFKKAFKYVGESGCGIPSITLAGTKQDWQWIYNKLDKLDEIGMNEWANVLKPVIQEFINVYDNKVNLEFWEDIYKDESMYGVFYLSGWIIKFFPYVKSTGFDVEYSVAEMPTLPTMDEDPKEMMVVAENTETDQDSSEDENEIAEEYMGMTAIEEKFVPNPFMKDSDYLLSTLSTDNLPKGIAQIDILWKNFFKDEEKKMELYAGFVACRQYDDLTLEPVISWVVCEKESENRYFDLDSRGYEETEHIGEKYWTPSIPKNTISQAVYNIRKFKDHQASVEYVKSVIKNAISSNPQFKDLDLSGVSVDFVVLSNGKISRVSLKGIENKECESFVDKTLKELPDQWFPALSLYKDLAEEYTESEEAFSKKSESKVKVNSRISINL